MFRQRQLDDETVHLRIGVQPGDLAEQRLFGRLLRQPQHGRTEPHLAAALLFMSHIRLARPVVADQNGHQMRRPFPAGDPSRHFGRNLPAQAGRHLFSVYYLHRIRV